MMEMVLLHLNPIYIFTPILVFHLDANADTDNIVDIDAGVLDIDVDSTATLNAVTSWTVTSPETTFESSTSHKPVVEIKNTTQTYMILI